MRFYEKNKPHTTGNGDVYNENTNNQVTGYRSEPLYGNGQIRDDAYSDEDLMAMEGVNERRLMMKIDLRLIPVLCVLYLLAFLDRVNIGNAVVFNLVEDLGLVGNQYNVALVIFFVPYCLFEIPSNVFLKRLKPHVWLSGNMLMFGIVSICQGLVQGYSGLLTTRFFLGLFETGIFPGSFYLIGTWYKREEAQKRFTFFFSSTTLAGAFGGLLASAIGKMDNLESYSGWRWIFILEGVLTCVVAIILFFLISDFPEDAKWLTQTERAFMKAKLASDQGKSALERKITLKDIVNVFKDVKVILGGFMYFGLIVPAYSFAYFAPTILTTYGYDPIRTQLFSVPPWAVAFVWAMIIATLSDLTKHRFGFIILCQAISISGLAMLLNLYGFLDREYAALFLITSGTYSAMPVVVCWFQMNLGGHHRRAVGTGWQIGFGNLGGIIAVFAFQAKDAPFFKTGYSICIGFICLSALSCIIYGLCCLIQNRNKDKSPTAIDLSEHEKTEMGDLSPDYRYYI